MSSTFAIVVVSPQTHDRLQLETNLEILENGSSVEFSHVFPLATAIGVAYHGTSSSKP
jgi:hypothetical protein